MILEVFTLFLVLAVVLIGVGLFQKESVHAIIGFSFLFILGVVLMGGVPPLVNSSLSYQSGENITMVSANNTIVEYSYTELDDATTLWIGRFLAIAAVAGFAAIFFEIKPFFGKKKKDSTYGDFS